MESLKIFVVGDPHLRSRYIKTAEEVVGRSIEEAKNAQPDIIVILGDTFDTNDVVKNGPFKLAEKMFIGLHEIAPLYVLVGNHDLCNPSQFLSENHFFGPYKKLGIKIVDLGLIETVKGFRLTFVPYVPTGRFREALGIVSKREGKKWSTSDLIFAHQEFKGSIPIENPASPSDAWSKDLPRIISGHIHTPMNLPIGVYYPGSPSQVKFDEPPNKNFWILTLFKDQGMEKPKIRIVKIPTKIRGKTTLEYSTIEDLEMAYKAGELDLENLEVKVKVNLDESLIPGFKRSNLYKAIKKDVNLDIVKRSKRVEIGKTKKTFLEILSESLDSDSKKLLDDVLSDRPFLKIRY